MLLFRKAVTTMSSVSRVPLLALVIVLLVSAMTNQWADYKDICQKRAKTEEKQEPE